MNKLFVVSIFSISFLMSSRLFAETIFAKTNPVAKKSPPDKLFWNLPLISEIKKMTRLPLEGESIPFVGYKTCDNKVECAEIFQKSWTTNCLARTRNLILEKSSDKIVEYKEQWLGECKAFLDHPLVSEIFKNSVSTPDKISIENSGIAFGIWYPGPGSLLIKAWCQKKNRRLRDCRMIELTAYSQKKDLTLSDKSIPW